MGIAPSGGYKGRVACINRHIGTAYDDVAIVAANIEVIESLSGVIESGDLDKLLENIDEVILVIDYMDEIIAVAGSIDAVELVAGSIDNVNLVATNIGSVNEVATNVSHVVTVSEGMDSVINVSDNIEAILEAPDNIIIMQQLLADTQQARDDALSHANNASDSATNALNEADRSESEADRAETEANDSANSASVSLTQANRSQSEADRAASIAAGLDDAIRNSGYFDPTLGSYPSPNDQTVPESWFSTTSGSIGIVNWTEGDMLLYVPDPVDPISNTGQRFRVGGELAEGGEPVPLELLDDLIMAQTKGIYFRNSDNNLVQGVLLDGDGDLVLGDVNTGNTTPTISKLGLACTEDLYHLKEVDDTGSAVESYKIVTEEAGIVVRQAELNQEVTNRTQGDADTLVSAKSYTDDQIGAIDIPSLSGDILAGGNITIDDNGDDTITVNANISWGDVEGNITDQTDLNDTFATKVDKTTKVEAGEGLIGGGDLGSDVQLSLDTNHQSIHAMSQAEFEALQEKRIRDGAGSGFAEWGLHYEDSSNNIPVNQGLWTNNSYINHCILGRGLTDTNNFGISRTVQPLANVNGAQLRIAAVSNSNRNRMMFPPAPDGTVTYDSDTGTITEHATALHAFGGYVVPDDWANWGYGNADNFTLDGLTASGDSKAGGSLTFSYGLGHHTAGTVLKFTVALETTSANGIRLNVYDNGYANLIAISAVATSLDGIVYLELEATVSEDGVVYAACSEIDIDEVGETHTLHNLTCTSQTEEVVTDRQDYCFLECWHELISDKDAVFPLGNVQYGSNTYEGLALSVVTGLGIGQGYSAFGEWDTVTEGYGIKWSLLTQADKLKFLTRSENNIYLNEDGELVQVRYRVRTIAGAGNGDWFSVSSIGSTSVMQYAALSTVEVRGSKATDANDFHSGASGRNFYGDLTDDNAVSGVLNTYTIHKSISDRSYGVGNVYALPICMVNRLNQGAYHPVWNPQGTTTLMRQNGTLGTVDWYHVDAKTPNSTAQCFDLADPVDNTVGNISPFANVNGGKISGSAEGRPDDQYYDAIYAAYVQDLRMSSLVRPLAEIREGYKRKAIAGEVRGWEKVPFTIPQTLDGTGTRPEADRKWVYWGSNREFTLYGDVFDAFAVGDLFAMNEKETGLTVTGIVSATDGTYITSHINTIHDAGGYTFADSNVYTDNNPNTVYSVSSYWLDQRAQEHTWTDIIGDPERIAATFPNGAQGQWIPIIPDGAGSLVIPLSRKALSFFSETLVTTDDGASWAEDIMTLDSVTNSVTDGSANIVGLVGLINYSTPAHFTEDADTAVILNLGQPWASTFYDEKRGCLMASTLIGKVLTDTSGGRVSVNRFLDSYYVGSSNILPANTSNPPSHSDFAFGAPSNNSPATKTLDYLTVESGKLNLHFAYKEMTYDGTWGDDNQFQITDGQSTLTDTNGNTVLYGTAKLQDHCVQYFYPEHVRSWGV